MRLSILRTFSRSGVPDLVGHGLLAAGPQVAGRYTCVRARAQPHLCVCSPVHASIVMNVTAFAVPLAQAFAAPYMNAHITMSVAGACGPIRMSARSPTSTRVVGARGPIHASITGARGPASAQGLT